MQKNEYDAIVKQLAHKKMSRGAYRMQLLGMYASMMKSIVFNLLVLFAGIAIGMGFTVMHMKNVWKEKYTCNSIHKLERVLVKHGAIDNEVEQVLIELKDKQIEQNEDNKKKAVR